ncbi:MAG: serine/threonine-protein kinase [Acidobacteriaceae bacterium]
MPKKGTVLKTATDTYTVDTRLGGGGAGEVFAVTDGTGNHLAAKVLRAELSTTKLKRFQNELMFGVRESHPHLIKVLDFGLSDENEPFYLMPLASGTLRAILKKGIENSRCLPIFSEILDGIEAAHLKGVIHRDLKPENILYYSTAPNFRVADFGVAHFEEEHLHTNVQTLPSDRLANFEYAAPEQRRPGVVVSLTADIYALGLILAELFTGEVPHGIGGVRISDRAPQYAYLDELVDKMRRQDPTERPQSIAAVKRDLMAQQNTFIETQKLDALRHIVVKDSEVTDPLINEPPELIGVKFTGSELIFQLSTPVNSKWIQTFQHMPMGGLLGYGPDFHTFQNNTGHVRATEQLAQRLIDQFKLYLRTANQIYARDVQAEETNRIQMERSRLSSQIKQEENLARIQDVLRW